MIPRRAVPILVLALLALAAAGCGATDQRSPAASAAAPEPNPRLLEFETRVGEAISRQGQLIRALASASVGTQARLGVVARQMLDWTEEELAWLDDHPADACYEEAAHAYREGLTDVALAAAAFSALATASAPPTDEEGQAAAETLAIGTESIERAAALAKSTRAACR